MGSGGMLVIHMIYDLFKVFLLLLFDLTPDWSSVIMRVHPAPSQFERVQQLR